MKQQLKLFFLSAIIIAGMFTALNMTLPSRANATYVEGLIEQDTIWTLTDSPFVLSKNVTVLPAATLTIEPGVEVRFGGNFSLIVEGRLLATGNQDNKITFTSNRNQPTTGDWNSIEFANAAQPSKLTYCVVRYAKNGTVIESSNVEITESQIANNVNGIVAVNSAVKVQTSSISDNLESGIYLMGDNEAIIQDNTIRANANGIFLAGESTLGIQVTGNTVLSNTQSGIEISVANYTNISILRNTVTSNGKGFYVSSQAETQITNNSVSYNKVGFYYENATHQVHWNDIYGNDLGMDVSSDGGATVHAEYNYWGHESGPHHPSLNPDGKGDTVGGDGYNLDFLFYLTAPISYINQRPEARLLADKTLVTPVSPDNAVTFVATNSSDDKRVNEYLYDFGDGTPSSGWTTLSIFTHRYAVAGDYTARVTVRDDFDVQSINTATVSISVQALTPLSVSLSLGSSAMVSEGQVQAVVRATIGGSPAADASIRLVSVARGILAILSGTTDSTGYFITMLAAPQVNEQTHVRIIATAYKNGYADGSDYEYLRVVPPLVAEVTLSPDLIKSEATTNGTVHVTYADAPISGATVRLSSDNGGTFSPEEGITDSDGDIRFTFAAPLILADLNITVTATAIKAGYWDGTAEATLIVQPRLLTVVVTANPETVESKDTAEVSVHVMSDGNPVTDATVSVVSDSGGNFSVTEGITDSDGYFKTRFTTPGLTEENLVTVTASATKAGYVEQHNQTQISVTPLPGPTPSGVFGLPLTTLLLIIIPIVAVVIVAVLIKMRIIVISRGEEEESIL